MFVKLLLLIVLFNSKGPLHLHNDSIALKSCCLLLQEKRYLKVSTKNLSSYNLLPIYLHRYIGIRDGNVQS